MYLSDSGLLHALLDIDDRRTLERHPKVGASWEGMMLETVIQLTGALREHCFFWRTHAGAELDLRLQRLVVIHAGNESFDLSKRVRAVAASKVVEDLKRI